MKTTSNRPLTPIPSLKMYPPPSYRTAIDDSVSASRTDSSEDSSSSATDGWWSLQQRFPRAPTLFCLNPDTSGQNSRTELLAAQPPLSYARYEAMQHRIPRSKYTWSNVPPLPQSVQTSFERSERHGTPFFLLAELFNGRVNVTPCLLPWFDNPMASMQMLRAAAAQNQYVLGYINTNTDRYRSLGYVPHLLADTNNQLLLQCLVRVPQKQITDESQNEAMCNVVVSAACFELGQALAHGRAIERDHTVADNYLRLIAPPLQAHAFHIGRQFARTHHHSAMEQLFEEKLQQVTMANKVGPSAGPAQTFWRGLVHWFTSEAMTRPPMDRAHIEPVTDEDDNIHQQQSVARA